MTEPKLRFKKSDGTEYPVWKTLALADIAERVVRKNKKYETDVPLTISSIDGLVDQRTYFGKTIASKDMSGYYLLKNGEFAYNKSYSSGYDFGSIKRLDKYEQGALSTLYICFNVKDENISDFMTCYFNSLVWNREMPMICAEGARNHGLLNVSANDFFTIPITMPDSIEEQKKIASFFSDIDEVIAQSEAEVAALEKQKKGAMQKIFSRELRFKNVDGTDYPEWKEVLLKDVGTIMTGTTPSTKQEEYYDGDYLWVTPADITCSRDVVTTNKKLTELGYNVARHIPANSVLVTCIASIGKNAILRVDGSCNQQINSVTPCSDYLVEFVYYNICINERLLHASAGSGGMEILNKENFSNIKMFYPCLEEQQKIADFLSDFDTAIDLAKQELERWKLLKKGLMQQMFV